MLNKVKAYGLEKFAGDEVKANEFVKGFVKAAVSSDEDMSGLEKLLAGIKRIPNASTGTKGETAGATVLSGFSKKLGEGVGGLFLNAGVAGLGVAASIVNNNHLYTKYLEALEKAIATNVYLKDPKDREKIKSYGATIFKFAPNIAADPNILSAVLANAVQGAVVDPMTMKTLIELESRYKENSSFTPKTYL